MARAIPWPAPTERAARSIMCCGCLCRARRLQLIQFLSRLDTTRTKMSCAPRPAPPRNATPGIAGCFLRTDRNTRFACRRNVGEYIVKCDLGGQSWCLRGDVHSTSRETAENACLPQFQSSSTPDFPNDLIEIVFALADSRQGGEPGPGVRTVPNPPRSRFARRQGQGQQVPGPPPAARRSLNPISGQSFTFCGLGQAQIPYFQPESLWFWFPSWSNFLGRFGWPQEAGTSIPAQASARGLLSLAPSGIAQGEDIHSAPGNDNS